MLGIHDLGLFVAAGLLLNILPGPDTAYIIGRSVLMGWRGGAAAAIGIGTGCLVHVTGSAIGLSALLATSSTAFTIVKLIGGAYLLAMGVRTLFAREIAPQPSQPSQSHDAETSLRDVFWQGALTNALNPKVALFFLAFLPQFVAADAPHQALAFLVLGAIFITNGTLWCLGVAAFAATAAQRFRSSVRAQLWINRAIGGLFIWLGLRIALLE